MSLMAANKESDPSAILNGFWVTLFYFYRILLVFQIPFIERGYAVFNLHLVMPAE